MSASSRVPGKSGPKYRKGEEVQGSASSKLEASKLRCRTRPWIFPKSRLLAGGNKDDEVAVAFQIAAINQLKSDSGWRWLER